MVLYLQKEKLEECEGPPKKNGGTQGGWVGRSVTSQDILYFSFWIARVYC